MKRVNEDWDRAAMIVAHPDDVEFGTSSAVARWTAQGKDVSYVLVTSGEAGIAGMRPADCGPMRESEQRQSAALVGVGHVEFLGYPDGVVEYGLRLRRDIAGVLRRLRPEVIVVMNFALTWDETGTVNHADHRAVGLAVLDACRDAANEWLFPELGEPWQGIKAVYVGGSLSATHYVEVTDTIETGIASLREHKAYLEALPSEFDPDDFLRNILGYGGMVVDCEYAVLLEAFNVG